MVEEARRFLLPLPADVPLPPGSVIRYDARHPQVFRCSGVPVFGCSGVPDPDGSTPQHRNTVTPQRLMLVGAGALGNFVALTLAAQSEPVSLTVIDPDYVEATNLNRQPAFLRSVGAGKAITLAQELRRLRPEMRVDHLAEPVQPEHFDRFQPEVVLSCVDRFAPRKLIHDECLKRRIPLLNGGTSAFSGHVEAYVPGRSACFNCLYTLNALAAREEEERADPSRCINASEPSIATTNALIGALMAAEAIGKAAPLCSMLRYDAGSPERMTAGRVRRACECWAEERLGSPA